VSEVPSRVYYYSHVRFAATRALVPAETWELASARVIK
jgi:hypothetical protein